uniref:Glucan endo-1,3-beta-D-glucosidase n=1 Tax=Ananas comosus var. bracteatus TaxID=296719 RepID=A0A6V7PX14_ANACO|nr:unnamed protein product [Ananas comosus var. bracteatus]
MAAYANLAEMYVGDDVSPDFYTWVFPKCDHVTVGTGTAAAKPAIHRLHAVAKLGPRQAHRWCRRLRRGPPHPRAEVLLAPLAPTTTSTAKVEETRPAPTPKEPEGMYWTRAQCGCGCGCGWSSCSCRRVVRGGDVGVAGGDQLRRVGSNLPAPAAVLPLLASVGVGRVRLYDAEPSVLRAFANTGVELVVGLPTAAWPPWPTRTRHWPGPAPTSSPTSRHQDRRHHRRQRGAHHQPQTQPKQHRHRQVSPAMESLHAALASLGLDRAIAVTTAHSLAVLASSYPPSSAVFRRRPAALPLPPPGLPRAHRLAFLVNAYPYFAYADDPSASTSTTPSSSPTRRRRPRLRPPLLHLLHAQVDAVYHAINAAAGDSAKTVEVRVSETGWPSAGDANETGATPQNAAKYNGNVMRLVAEGKGTPLRPGVALRAYVFALFNENLKPGPTSERNYGLFKPDGTPVYPLGITVPPDNSTTPRRRRRRRRRRGGVVSWWVVFRWLLQHL